MVRKRGKNWKKRSREIREKEQECAKCEEEYPPSELETHHRTYFPGDWSVPDWALEPLCHDCHREVHNAFSETPGKRSNFFEQKLAQCSFKFDKWMEIWRRF